LRYALSLWIALLEHDGPRALKAFKEYGCIGSCGCLVVAVALPGGGNFSRTLLWEHLEGYLGVRAELRKAAWHSCGHLYVCVDSGCRIVIRMHAGIGNAEYTKVGTLVDGVPSALARNAIRPRYRRLLALLWQGDPGDQSVDRGAERPSSGRIRRAASPDSQGRRGRSRTPRARASWPVVLPRLFGAVPAFPDACGDLNDPDLNGRQLGIVLEECVEGAKASTRRPLGGLEAEWSAGRDYALMRLLRGLVKEEEEEEQQQQQQQVVPVPGPSAMALVRSSFLLLVYGMRVDGFHIVTGRTWYAGATGPQNIDGVVRDLSTGFLWCWDYTRPEHDIGQSQIDFSWKLGRCRARRPDLPLALPDTLRACRGFLITYVLRDMLVQRFLPWAQL